MPSNLYRKDFPIHATLQTRLRILKCEIVLVNLEEGGKPWNRVQEAQSQRGCGNGSEVWEETLLA